MPYTERTPERDACEDRLRDIADALDVGGLTWAVTILVDEWVSGSGVQYARLAHAVGALECAKLELYRRVAAPYEDTKVRLNGDVYQSQHSVVDEDPYGEWYDHGGEG